MDDGRKHQRCSVHWRSAISIVGTSGPQTLQCKTNDVSAGGVSLICPLNIFPDRELTVYLLIDPGSPTTSAGDEKDPWRCPPNAGSGGRCAAGQQVAGVGA